MVFRTLVRAARAASPVSDGSMPSARVATPTMGSHRRRWAAALLLLHYARGVELATSKSSPRRRDKGAFAVCQMLVEPGRLETVFLPLVARLATQEP
eukprot:480556-Prymnesium_polylepis.1